MSTPKPKISEKSQKCIELLQELFKNEKIKPSNSTRRSIMFVGKTRAGKSTVIKILQKASYVPPNLKIFSDTVDASISSFSIEKTFDGDNDFQEFVNKMEEAEEYEKNVSDKDFEKRIEFFDKEMQEKMREERKQRLEKEESEKPKIKDCITKETDGKVKLNCCIDIIDTPGLFEIKEIGSTERDNESLKKTILQCMEHEITKIHCIFFVCSFTEGINTQDIESFVHFMRMFDGAENKISLLITRSENLDEEQKKELINNLKKEPRMKKLIQQIGDRIYFTGAISSSLVENESIEEAEFYLENIESLRNHLIESIILSFSPCSMNSISFVSKYEVDLIAKMQNFLKKLSEGSSGVSTVEGQRKREMDTLLHEINELKTFVVSEEASVLFKQVSEYEIKELFDRVMQLTTKTELSTDEKQELDIKRSKLDQKSSFITKDTPVFKDYCKLNENEFKEICSKYEKEEKPNKEKYIEDLRTKKAFLLSEESKHEYKSMINKLRTKN